MSHRWHHVAHAAPLLRPLYTSPSKRYVSMSTPSHARSFTAWLRRHGGNLSIVSLFLGSFNNEANAARVLQPELPPLLSTLASSATRLERLQLDLWVPLPAALPLPPSLKRLSIQLRSDGNRLPVGCLSGLSELEALYLHDCDAAPDAEQVRANAGLCTGLGWAGLGWQADRQRQLAGRYACPPLCSLHDSSPHQ